MSRIKKSKFHACECNTNDTGFRSYLKIGMFLEVPLLPSTKQIQVEQSSANVPAETTKRISNKRY